MIPKINNISYIPFKALHPIRIEEVEEDTKWNHTTRFFRYSQCGEPTDEALIMLMQRKNSPVNILSAGCSYGEEVYTFATACRAYGINARIKGVDISPLAIEVAKEGVYTLDALEEEYISVEDKYKQNYRAKVTSMFKAMFEKSPKNESRWEAKDGEFMNCSFEARNISDLGTTEEENSQDLILCRYVLYHIDNLQTLRQTINGFYTILKPSGLLSLNSQEYEKYEELLQLQGFKQPYRAMPWIFQKPHKDNFKIYLNEANINQNPNLKQISKEKVLSYKPDLNDIYKSF
ncbi:MAG: methyltransferase domain-containing protein [Candidatus Gastranaerophilales bacterium]|nr:methyltransferase domain-containing protein [Candidatus Gastranaerophilales bacterium]